MQHILAEQGKLSFIITLCSTSLSIATTYNS